MKMRQDRWLLAEVVLAALSGVLAAVTFVWPDWIELVFRVDPDGGSGWLEWAVAGSLLLASAALGLLARARYTRPQPS